MIPQALTRLDGTVLGVRTVIVPAAAATEDRPARPASSYREVDVLASAVAYDGQVVDNVSAILPVILGDDDIPPGAGEVVAWFVLAYPTVRKTATGWRKVAAHRFCGVVPAESKVPARAGR